MIYTVVIYNDNGAMAAALENAGTPIYNRSKNAADQISIEVPRNDDKVSEVETGRRFEILRATDFTTTQVEASGYISNHGYSGEMYEIEGFTEEIVLSRHFTPAQYGYPLQSENQTLDTLVAQLEKSFIIEQAKHDWGSYVSDSSNIDYTTNPTFVLLQNQTPGGEATYPTSGYAVFRFQKLASEEWERFRWVSDYYTDEDGEVKTEVSYRQGDTIAELEGNTFTQSQGGTLPDVVGIVVSNPNKVYLEVKVDFTTDTTEASPVLFSLEVIKRGLTLIDTVEALGDAQLENTPGLTANNTSFLDVLIAALEPSGWEFKVYNGKLSIAETFGVDRTDDYSLVADGVPAPARTTPPEFNPTQISGLALWLDASDTNTITSSSGSVSQWDDKSGNNRHVSQGDATYQPITGSASLNGMNVLSFNDHRLSGGLTLPQPFTIMALSRRTSGDAASNSRLVTGDSSPQLQHRATGQPALAAYGGTFLYDYPEGNYDDFMVLCAVYDGANSLALWQYPETEGDVGAGEFTGTVNIGAIPLYFVGDLAEVAIYSYALDLSKIDRLRSYLSNKWDVTVS